MGLYCQKNCDRCNMREESGCGGCDNVLKSYGCELAKCCKDKGHRVCMVCRESDYCELYKNKEAIPIEHMKCNGRLAERNRQLTKWFSQLFIVMLVRGIVSILVIGAIIVNNAVLTAVSGTAGLIVDMMYLYVIYNMSKVKKAIKQ